MTETLVHHAPLWRWTGAQGAWFFVTIDGANGEALSATALMRRLEGGTRPGWGSLKVAAEIGDTRFATSVFPSKEDGGWLLPVKKAVRLAEGLAEGAEVAVTLRY